MWPEAEGGFPRGICTEHHLSPSGLVGGMGHHAESPMHKSLGSTAPDPILPSGASGPQSQLPCSAP